MADTSKDDKTEAASPRRIEKAREQGQIVRSRELNTFMMLLVGVGALWGMGGPLYDRVSQLMVQGLMFERAQAFDDSRMLSAAWAQCQAGLFAVFPFLLVMALTALGASMLLGGVVVTLQALQPNFSRMNPVSGLARMFSVQVLAELGKALAKAFLVGIVAVIYLRDHAQALLALTGMPIEQAVASAMHMLAVSCALIIGSLVLVVGLDVPYQLWSYATKLKMTKEEVRQEHKDTDGDPHIKARIRKQQQLMARSRMMSKVPKADVIVTNPTHYAVALAYKDQKMGAPRVIAKGADAVAARIREVGAEHRIPVLEAPTLARALYFHVDLDREIPTELYTAVAEVVAWAIRLRRVNEAGGVVPPTPKNLPVPPGMDQPGPQGADPEETQN
ncbi:flagellar biosynthesis protein FlhB [Pseudomonas abieticivorans]|uniref:flagellar biosynthesis protein FlhB n=1 Tax=Pseudomonas abieticivorans TaxID=2931382 RepID=UPI0020BDC3E1|nr:flagellar biosynthesis protein FlhB [Pseudomonas sp. PIA16]